MMEGQGIRIIKIETIKRNCVSNSSKTLRET